MPNISVVVVLLLDFSELAGQHLDKEIELKNLNCR
jgi:hypothetical protein